MVLGPSYFNLKQIKTQTAVINIVSFLAKETSSLHEKAKAHNVYQRCFCFILDETKVTTPGNIHGSGPLPSFLPFYFSCSRFPLSQFSGPDYLSLFQANSDVMAGIMSEKVNEVLKNYTLLYLKIKVKLCHSPSGLMALRNFQPRNR